MTDTCIYTSFSLYICVYGIVKAMFPSGYRHNGFVATHALGHIMYITVHNRTSSAKMHELQQSHCGDNREGTLFSRLHIYYAHLASVRFEHYVCCGSLLTNYIIFVWLNALFCLFYIETPA